MRKLYLPGRERERERVGESVSRSRCIGGEFTDVLNFISTAIWVMPRAVWFNDPSEETTLCSLVEA